MNGFDIVQKYTVLATPSNSKGVGALIELWERSNSFNKNTIRILSHTFANISIKMVEVLVILGTKGKKIKDGVPLTLLIPTQE